MCGIVGYTGTNEAIDFLIPALRRLEYRGYDSAGIATLNGAGVVIHKSVGKIRALEGALVEDSCRGRVGVAHTRWATHGPPSRANAHPHTDCSGRIALVHNGIVENYREIRRRLAADGHRFSSNTDSEVLAHLVEDHLDAGPVEALRRMVREVSGSFALALITDSAPGTLFAFRRGNPLIAGRGRDEAFLASDIPALLHRTRDVVVLGDDELGVLTPEGIDIRHVNGGPVRRDSVRVEWDEGAAEKEGYPHFMLKEIFEQPRSLRATMAGHVDPGTGEVEISELGLGDDDMARLNRLCFVACGTSWHAALVGQYLVEHMARLPVVTEIGSEFQYREPVVDGRTLAVSISQSGETADTLAALRTSRNQGSRTLAICNVVGSSIARESDGVLYTRAGLEIGVASTKAFTAQLVALTMLAVKLGRGRGFLEAVQARGLVKELLLIPEKMERIIAAADSIRRAAERLVDSRSALFLGRGIHTPLALEGALKLKEISYIHAEGFPAGEMKHGPIALIEAGLPVVAISPRGPSYEKMAGNMEEAGARGAAILAIAEEKDEEIGERADVVLSIPRTISWLQPLLVSLPLQLLAYYAAVLRGCDVDQPRNLAKSVTVE